MREGTRSRYTEHTGTHTLETDSGKVSALSCLALCSEPTTVSFELWLHFAGTCIGHFLHYICALLGYLCIVPLTTL